MSMNRDSQIDKLLEDVASIKSVLTENKPILKQLLLPVHFRLISVIAGLAFIGLSALYYFLLDRYGSYYEIPDIIRTLSLIVVLALYVLVVLLKRFLWVKSVKKLDSGYTFGKLIKKIYTYQLLHVWIPIIGVMGFLVVYLSIIDAERYIVSVAAIGMGIIYNSMGAMIRIWQYLVTGYWLLLTGLLPFIFPEVSVLIFLGFSLGVGFLLFYMISGGSQVIEEEG